MFSVISNLLLFVVTVLDVHGASVEYKVLGISEQSWYDVWGKCIAAKWDMATVYNLEEAKMLRDTLVKIYPQAKSGVHLVWLGGFVTQKGRLIDWFDGKSSTYVPWMPLRKPSQSKPFPLLVIYPGTSANLQWTTENSNILKTYVVCSKRPLAPRAPAYTPFKCQTERGIQFEWKYYGTTNLGYSGSPEDCCQKCVYHLTQNKWPCVAWSYDHHRRECHVNVAGRYNVKRNSRFTSGRPGTDGQCLIKTNEKISGWEVGTVKATHYSDCCYLCSVRENCEMWMWEPIPKQCKFYKKGTTSKQTNSGKSDGHVYGVRGSGLHNIFIFVAFDVYICRKLKLNVYCGMFPVVYGLNASNGFVCSSRNYGIGVKYAKHEAVEYWNVPDPTGCCQKCNYHPDCKHWSHNKYEKKCFLKYQMGWSRSENANGITSAMIAGQWEQAEGNFDG